MKNNKNLMTFILLTVCLLGLTFSANAQKRRNTKTKKANTASTAQTTTTANAAEIKANAEKVSVQIKNLTKFIYVLGSVAHGIEEIDKQAKDGKVAKSALDLNAENKQKVIQTIRNLRAGLMELEVNFRAKPELRNYNSQILGINDLSAQAEDLAVAGRFTESGKPLLLIVEKLSDTLVGLP